MDKAEQPTITQSVDVFAERKAFEVWWANWVPDGTMPSVTSHIFDAWLASARHRTTSLAAQDGLVEALRVAREYVQNVVDAEGKAFNVRDLVQIDAALSAIKEQHHD